ncbi:catalase [Terrilactibacillus sp. BCM23-1]|uniref:Catalase n=1 Tax=Terrilactibacillus tamarindi TaxID=2599694 RepID=A0A6N8CMA6_9BACI|nr:catalase [Terrilactibacillus tamarindi]MTT31152.1 catalase [Terrilactibacillus tamarindi]
MSKEQEKKSVEETSKKKQLDSFTKDNNGQKMTTNQGLKVSDDENSLKAGERGPSLLEDFYLREKIMHFDHERIPERVVHARGYGVHGYFQVYESLAEFTKAKFLQDPSVKTPVFVRFSTVAGSRGSGDTVRDVRGFATKFYTEEGNYDLVGNNIPVFFIQDAIKFPDLVHSFKPEPNNEIPQAQTAHDTFWDFVANNPESAHMVMWAMSDRAIPRSYRMMEGFGVHTFRFVNQEGKSRFVKFHWKPKLGVRSLVWDEAQKIAGKDPDFHRRDLYEAIEMGQAVEFELGVQMIEEEDEFRFDFDILDPTKLWPEEVIPVKIIGKMTLNRNPDNYFAETEQVAFHPGNVVPGIDFSNDPLLQGRLFSYTDTQLTRLGGPNFHEIPINRPVCPFHNHQNDGYHRMTINKGPVSYHKNSLQNNTPATSTEEEGGYVHYQEKVEGRKVRTRSDSFNDYFSQAKMFWNSMTDVEKEHILSAFCFEVGKVKNKGIRKQVVDLFSHVDYELAKEIASNVGVDGSISNHESTVTLNSPALSQETKSKSPKSSKIAILAEDGFNSLELNGVLDALNEAGAIPEVVSNHLGVLSNDEGQKLDVSYTFQTSDSVLFDAIYVAGGEKSVEKLMAQKEVEDFIYETFKHYKTIGAADDAVKLLEKIGLQLNQPGIVAKTNTKDLNAFNKDFIEAITEQRHWKRQL